MKKAVSVVLVLTIVMAFFSFNVFADTTTRPEYIGKVNKSYTPATDLIVYLRAMEFDPVIGQEIVNVSGSPGIRVYQATTSVLITVKIVNNTDYVKLIDPMYLDLYMTYASNYPNGYGIPRGVLNVISYSDDLLVTYNYTNGTSMTIMSSVDWTVDGCIAVPPNSQLVGLTEIQYGSYYQYDSNGYTAKYPTLDKIELYQTPTVYGTTKTPIGMSSGGSSYNYTSQLTQIVDFLDSIDDSNADIYSAVDGLEAMVSQIYGSVDQIEGYVDGIEGYIDGIEGLLGNIKTLLTWTGSFPTVSYSSLTRSTYTGYSDSQNRLSYTIERVYSGGYPVLDMTDFETPNNTYSNKLYKHTFVYYVDINNVYSDPLRLSNGRFRIYQFMPTTNIRGIQLYSFFSEDFYNPYIFIGSNAATFYVYPSQSFPVLNVGHHRYVVYFDVFSQSSTIPALNDPIIDTLGTISVYNDEISSESDAAGQLSDEIHQQETIWYDQNSSAMESVGLSNYQYNTQQYNGILGVTFQFEQLWTALGYWNLVYIFTLMLSLATFIIRHRPSTKMQQRMIDSDINREASLRTRLAKDQVFKANYERAWWRHHQ